MMLTTQLIIALLYYYPSTHDAFLIHRKPIGETKEEEEQGDPIQIDIRTVSTVGDISEKIRLYLGITGLSGDSVWISHAFGGDHILNPSLLLADACIKHNSKLYYYITPLILKNVKYSLCSVGRLSITKTCNETFRISIGHPDFLGELERQFRKWMINILDEDESDLFINVPITFAISFAGIKRKMNGSTDMELRTMENAITSSLDEKQHRGFSYNRYMKALLVNNRVISKQDPVLRNRMIARRFDYVERGDILRLQAESVPRPSNVCQCMPLCLSTGPISVSQLSPATLTAKKHMQCQQWESRLYNEKQWNCRSRIVLYFVVPLGFDLILM